IEQETHRVRCNDSVYTAAWVARAVRHELLHNHFKGMKDIDVEVVPQQVPDSKEQGKFTYIHTVTIFTGKYRFNILKNHRQFDKYWRKHMFQYMQAHPNYAPDSDCCLLCPSIVPNKISTPLAICACAQQRAMRRWIAYGPSMHKPESEI